MTDWTFTKARRPDPGTLCLIQMAGERMELATYYDRWFIGRYPMDLKPRVWRPVGFSIGEWVLVENGLPRLGREVLAGNRRVDKPTIALLSREMPDVDKAADMVTGWYDRDMVKQEWNVTVWQGLPDPWREP